MIDLLKYKTSLLLVTVFLAAGRLLGQSEPESSTSVLEVRSISAVYKLRHTYEVGDRVKVQVDSATQWQRGRILQIEDSTLTLPKTAVPISHITHIKSHPNFGNIFLGTFLALLMLGAGFATGLLIRAIVQKQPLQWYQWILFCAGALVCFLFVPAFFAGALVTWAFASRNFPIRNGTKLEVKRIKNPAHSAPNEAQ
jgi:hypothetical protein